MLRTRASSRVLFGLSDGVLQSPLMHVQICLAEQHKPDELDRGQVEGFGEDGAEGDVGGFLDGITEDAGGDGGESDGRDAAFLGQLQCVAVAGGQEDVRGRVDPVHGPQAVDDVFVGQPVRAGDDRLAGADGRERTAFLSESRSRSPVDCPRHPASRRQPGVRRVHNRIDVRLLDDVALYAFEPDAVFCHSHRIRSATSECTGQGPE